MANTNLILWMSQARDPDRAAAPMSLTDAMLAGLCGFGLSVAVYMGLRSALPALRDRPGDSLWDAFSFVSYALSSAFVVVMLCIHPAPFDVWTPATGSLLWTWPVNLGFYAASTLLILVFHPGLRSLIGHHFLVGGAYGAIWVSGNAYAFMAWYWLISTTALIHHPVRLLFARGASARALYIGNTLDLIGMLIIRVAFGNVGLFVFTWGYLQGWMMERTILVDTVVVFVVVGMTLLHIIWMRASWHRVTKSRRDYLEAAVSTA